MGESCGNLIIPNMYNANKMKIITHKPINNSYFNIPKCFVKSATEKNFNAKANSTNPKNTFTEFNHPPDCGKEFNHLGKMANKVNGKANAIEKPNIPNKGPLIPSWTTPKISEPIIGPVHENETNAKVNAMKKIPTKPPLEDNLSVLFAHELGKVIS